FLENNWDGGALCRPRHRDRIALARLNRDATAEVSVQLRRPGAGGENESVGGQPALGSGHGLRPAVLTEDSIDRALLPDFDTLFDQDALPFGHEPIRAQMRVGFVKPAAGEAGLQCRLQL